MTVRTGFIAISIGVTLLILLLSLLWKPVMWLFVLVIPLILVGIRDMTQKSSTLLRLYPVIGNLRYFMEYIRPEIQQYFIEGDTDGMPISREFRALVYQRAKGARDTRPFGTVFDVYKPGYEWINQSLAPHEI